MTKEKTLADRIKSAREKLGLSQTRLAVEAGVTPSTVSRLESGAVKQVKSEVLGQLAQALGLTVDALLGKAQPQIRFRLKIPIPNGPGPDDLAHFNDPILNRILRYYLALDKSRKRQALEYLEFLSRLKDKQT